VQRRDRWLGWGCAAAAFVVYWLTLAPVLVGGDAPDLTVAAFQAGVPHPTGYPLYTLLGFLFTHLPGPGDPAFRMNLLSALYGGAAVGVIYHLARLWVRNRGAAAAAALLFGFSRTFWSQAVGAEVYTLHLLLVSSVLLCVLLWDRDGCVRRIRAAALLYGLCFTHHLSSVLMAPALLVLLFTSRHRGRLWRELPQVAALFCAPLVLYVHLPLAAARNPDANWGDPSNLTNFLAHVSGRQYRVRMFEGGWQAAWRHLSEYLGIPSSASPAYLPRQFGAWLLVPAAVGMMAALKRRTRAATVGLLYYVAVVLWAINYNIGDVEVYFLGAHLIVALGIGVGLQELAVRTKWIARRSGGCSARSLRVTPALLLATAVTSTALGNWDGNDHHHDRDVLAYARAALDSLPRNALLIGGGDNPYFPLTYVHYVEGRRPDVELAGYYDLLRPARIRRVSALRTRGVVVNVPPEHFHPIAGRSWTTALLARILEDNVARRPVLLLGEPVRMLASPHIAPVLAPYALVDRTNIHAVELQRLGSGSPTVRPVAPVATGFARFEQQGGNGGGAMELVSFTSEAYERGGQPWVRLRYGWQGAGGVQPATIQVRAVLGGSDGTVAANADGSPRFVDQHYLGLAPLPGTGALPSAFSEAVELYVPPSAGKGPWTVWLEVRSAAGSWSERARGAGPIPVAEVSPLR
jgi:hypothetical protein